MKKIEKYIKDGNVAILISPGYGAGWSTWNKQELAYDKRVVEFYLLHKDDENFDEKAAGKLFESWGYPRTYFGGFKTLFIRWLPEGTKYIIKEYDGFESIETDDTIGWQIA